MKTPDLDTDLAAIPEIIADTLTQDPATARRLCERARRHWKTNGGFRRSFKRKDERSVLAMWFQHWLDGESLRSCRCLDMKSKLHD